MPQPSTGCCPDCTYPLAGLTQPRCPECGLQFDPRLLTDPSLAVPRPAWERRPRVGRLYASYRTLIDVTFRPKKFFASIQQPNGLRHALAWPVYMIAISTLIGVVYDIAEARAGWRGQGTILLYAQVAASTLVDAATGWSIVLLPLALFFLAGDLLLWKDRPRYRLLVKGVCYSMTIYVWFTPLICGLLFLLGRMSAAAGNMAFHLVPWITYMIVVATGWQYGLLYWGVMGASFGRLLPASVRSRTLIRVLAGTGWVITLYLGLFDAHLGMRFRIALWTIGQ